MFVSFLRTKTGLSQALLDMPAPMPPFWELEALIAEGYDADAALVIMAQRRSALELARGGAVHRHHPTPPCHASDSSYWQNLAAAERRD